MNIPVYTIFIDRNTPIQLSGEQCEELLTEKAYKLLKKTAKQGGIFIIGIGSLKPCFQTC
jgi:hypothetical protein